MTALVSAELLRLRTVRSTPWIVVVTLALVAVVAAINVEASLSQRPADLVDSLAAMALLGILVPALCAASNVATDFQRGWASMTYLIHPRRERVTAARALTYAGLGFVFAGLAAAVGVAVGLSPLGADAGLPAADIAQLIAGAAAGCAVLSVVGVLLGAVTRHPMIATGVLVALSFFGTLLRSAGVGRYLPFDLINALMGMSDGIAAPAALGLLLAYVAALALFVRVWALPRDLT